MQQASNLPESHYAPTETILAINLVEIGTSNYRREEEFDQASLEELASDIARHGLLQPVLLREVEAKPYRYELISGERRMRASRMAGLSTIEAIIKKVDEPEAILMRLSENLHRKDVHPLSEAAVYRQLALMGYTTREISGKVSKSEGFVVSRIILNELLPYWKGLFFEGGINEKTAMVIARLTPDNQRRLESLFPRKNIEADGRIIRPYSFNAVNDVITTKLLLSLSASDFPKEDSSLYAVAGSCLSCPKRTGFNKMLFAEITTGDFCMDETCFNKKNALHFTRQRQKLALEGKPILELSTVYTRDERMLHKSEVEILPASQEMPKDAKKVIVANGESIGKILHVRIKGSPESSLEKTADRNEKRKEQLLKEKREKEFAGLLSCGIVDMLATSLLQKDAASYGKILDYLIIERIGNGHSQPLLDHLSARYGWPRIDRSHVESRGALIAHCVEATPTKRKIELFVDLFVYAKALDENKGKLYAMAKAIGMDVDSIRRKTGLGEENNPISTPGLSSLTDIAAA